MPERRGLPTVTSCPAAWDSRRVLVVVFLVVGAGCGALPSGTEAPTAVDTLTPVSVPNASDGETRDDDTLPPGVSAGGTLDGDRLARAHADALAGTSYTETLARTVTVAGVPTTVSQSLRRVAVDGTATLVERSGPGLRPRRILYSDRTGTYLRTSRRNRTRVTELNGTGRVPAPDRTVSRFLSGLEVSLVPVTVRGTRLYRLVGAPAGRTHALELPAGRTTVANYTVTALVSPSGFLGEVTVTYRRSDRGGPRHVRVTVEYTGLGATTVSRPEWVPDGRIATRDNRSSP